MVPSGDLCICKQDTVKSSRLEIWNHWHIYLDDLYTYLQRSIAYDSSKMLTLTYAQATI